LFAAALVAFSAQVHAQGCVVARQLATPQVSGHDYLKKHQADISIDYRGFTAQRLYDGDTYNAVRTQLGSYVINRQNQFNLTGELGISGQTSLFIDLPYSSCSWSVPIPAPYTGHLGGPRYQMDASGIGDLSVVYKVWIMNTVRHPNENVNMGIGVEAPTGADNAKSPFPNGSGTDDTNRTVDQSIQPGDGGWGIPTSVEMFAHMGKINLFATGNYLINPRDTNGTPSILTALGGSAPPIAPSLGVNSVPDQYLIRIGAGCDVPKVTGLSASVDWRKEGVPVKDVIGGSHGFRRPGFSIAIEPGLCYTRNDTTYSVSAPLTINKDRLPTDSDGTSISGDASFTDSQVIISISHRYGE
jgi:hypothetical protein